jgi:hypothetical protein
MFWKGCKQMPKPTRKGSTPAKVYCLPSELEELKCLAALAGLPLSTYLLRVGLGYPVRSIVDNRRVEDLCRINGDLGRLGGLLKLWLTDDPRTAEFGEATIRAVLSKLRIHRRKCRTSSAWSCCPKSNSWMHLYCCRVSSSSPEEPALLAEYTISAHVSEASVVLGCQMTDKS